MADPTVPQAGSSVHFMDCVYLSGITTLYTHVYSSLPQSVYLGDLDGIATTAVSHKISRLIYADHCCDRGFAVVYC